MEPSDQLLAVRADGERLISVAAEALDALVPACPGWDNTKLLTHTLRVWGSMAWVLEHRATEPAGRDSAPDRPAPDETVAAARVQLDRLVAALTDIDPETPLWTWGTTDTARFYFRRMANETLIHRIDAEQAAGLQSAIDAGHATDCIDELFTEQVRSADPAPDGSFHLHRTDGEGEWMLTVLDGRIVCTREHAKGDAALRGSAADLLLAISNRRSLDGMELFGDRAVAESWIALNP